MPNGIGQNNNLSSPIGQNSSSSSVSGQAIGIGQPIQPNASHYTQRMINSVGANQVPYSPQRNSPLLGTNQQIQALQSTANAMINPGYQTTTQMRQFNRPHDMAQSQHSTLLRHQPPFPFYVQGRPTQVTVANNLKLGANQVVHTANNTPVQPAVQPSTQEIAQAAQPTVPVTAQPAPQPLTNNKLKPSPPATVAAVHSNQNVQQAAMSVSPAVTTKRHASSVNDLDDFVIDDDMFPVSTQVRVSVLRKNWS